MRCVERAVRALREVMAGHSDEVKLAFLFG